MSRQFFSGNSIEQAVMAAARHYGVDPEKIAYSTRDKKHGFLNIRRRVVIEVDPEKPQLTTEDLGHRPSRDTPKQAKPVAPVEDAEAADGDTDLDHAHDVEVDSPDDDSYTDSYDDASDDDSSDDETGEVDDDFEDEDEDDEDTGEFASDVDSVDEESAKRGGRGARGDSRRGRQGGDKPAREQGGDRRPERSRKQDSADGDNVRMYRGVKVDWKEEVELEGVSRELAAFEFAVEQTLDVMDLEIEYTIVEGETFKIEFSGEDAELLTEDDGRVLKAFEHVLPRIVRGLVGDTLNCKVDCEGFRAEHEDKLVELAQEAADEVRESGDAKVLTQMNPSDRRIIHLALVNDPDVETVSQGRGYMKRVRIQLLDEE